MKKGLLSIIAMAVLMLASSVGYAQTTYTRVTSASGLEAGGQYIIVGYDEALGYCAMSYQKTANRHAIPVTENGGSITVTPATDPNSQTEVFQFTLENSGSTWSFFDELKNGYLYAASSSANQLKTQTTLDDNGKWVIEFDADGNATVTAQGDNTRNIMRFNENSSNGAPLFSCYNSSSSINVPVSFYKAGGSAQPDPEPSNYPTNFVASVTTSHVALRWTDATGTQLPSKYLVVGSTGNITVPTDGTPVANGELTANVNYGVQEVGFSGLVPNTTYHFAIFPYTNGGANIDYKTDGNYPTVTVYVEPFTVLLDEDFEGDGLGSFFAYDVTGDQAWAQATYNQNSYAYMNGYEGGAHENEDWLITSGAMDGNYQFIYLSFRTAMKFTGDDLRVKVSSEYDGSSDPNQFFWNDITDLFNYSTGNYTWAESGEVNISSSVGSLFYLAFVYTSSDEGAAAWEVDDVLLVATNANAVGELSEKELVVAPNPANDMVRFTLEEQAQVIVYDLSGRMVSFQPMNAGENKLDVAQLESGVYFLNVRYADGATAVTRFVKF